MPPTCALRPIIPSNVCTLCITAAVAGMGWGLHPQALIAAQLQDGSLVELVPGTPQDVALHWQHARAASTLLDALGRRVVAAAARALLPP